MAESRTIPNKAPDNVGLDYAYLRQEGVDVLQRLSSSIWTDYNEHDPGVTTLEQLCYALTELSYRAELPVEQLLVDRETGAIQPHRHALFIPRRILPCNPVTVHDYRKRIVDRIPAVHNVWLTPAVPQGSHFARGLYDIYAYVPPGEIASRRRIAKKIRRVYCEYRNLCEDVQSVHILEPQPTKVHAEVMLAPGEGAEQVLAAIFFELGKLLAPELQRRPLAAMLLDGYSADEIFNGPILNRGFIADDQLRPKATSIAVNEMIAVMSSVAGVAGSKDVWVTTHDDPKTYRINDSVPISDRKYLNLDTLPNEGKRFSIRLTRDGVTCHPRPAQVAILLKLMWDAYRQSYPLKNQYDEFFPLPTAAWRDLALYYSVQDQYPGVYGINSFGPPGNATTERLAQAKQLKAYLLPFEQLMADYFAQVANIRNLFSIFPDSLQTYSFQSLVKSVPDVKPVLRPDYLPGLANIVSSHDPFLARRNAFLDFLLSLYASPLNQAALSQCGQCTPSGPGLARLVRAKLALLRSLVVSTRDRSRAMDYLEKPDHLNAAGMQIRCRIELGLGCGKRRRLCDVVGESGMRLARTPGDASIDESAELHAVHIRNHFRPASSSAAPPGVPPTPSCLRGSTASDEFISVARDLDSLLIGRVPNSEITALVCQLPSTGWTVIGRYADSSAAVLDAHAVSRHCRELHRARNQLYIVEHNLLRFGRHRRADEDPFVYDFTLTAVVGLPCGEWKNPESRAGVREIIRQNTPAHLVADVCFLQPWGLLRFEYLYCAWRDALRHGSRRRRERTSARMRRFLLRHTLHHHEA